jgi:energy-coupling factor transporter ATP-binding protein EcfA2
VIHFDRVSITYDGAQRPVLRDVNLRIDEGELCLVIGRTGSGKSTLLGAINGLVPHFTGGTLAGRVTVDGRDTATNPPRELADVVGVVGQDPLAGFVTDTVEEELAYGMEQLAVPPDVMRKRVEETLDLLGLAELRQRALHELSGGQQQRVAIGSVLTVHPRILVLDEPTSALDPTAAEEVLAAVTRLVHDLGVTVVLAEHRLERVVQYADRVVHLAGDGTVVDGPPADMFTVSTVAPPVVELGRLAGWRPLPLSVRDARREAGPLRERLSGRPIPTVRRPTAGEARDTGGSNMGGSGTGGSDTGGSVTGSHTGGSVTGSHTGGSVTGSDMGGGDTGMALWARKVLVRYGDVIAVRGVDLDLAAGQVTALMGRNGSGKSSLLWALQGSGPRQSGSVQVRHTDPRSVSAAAARRLVGLVPQTPTDLLYLDRVGDELAQADRDAVSTVSARRLLDRLAPGIDDASHPRDLSEGQRLSLVLAIQLCAAPGVLLLDEPTRGLDYAAKQALIRIVDGLAAEGRSIVISTHDVEFVASAADRVIVMAEGDIVADGPTGEVIVASPAFAPQVAKILAPLAYLTVGQVAAALDGTGH